VIQNKEALKYVDKKFQKDLDFIFEVAKYNPDVLNSLDMNSYHTVVQKLNEYNNKEKDNKKHR
jgi:hypothetical protein